MPRSTRTALVVAAAVAAVGLVALLVRHFGRREGLLLEYTNVEDCRAKCSDAKQACKDQGWGTEECKKEFGDACKERCKARRQSWRDRCRSTCDYTYQDDKKKAKKCRKGCADHWD